MKKLIKIFLVMICICLTGCNTESKISLSSNIKFITSGTNYYKNGCIYGNETTMFLDFDTMEKAPLCAKPNCTHDNSECIAKTVGDTPVFYNDYIYYFKSNGGAVIETTDDREFYIDSKLYKANLETSETEIVCEFHDGVPVLKWAGYVLQDNELYFTIDDCNPIKDEYGGYTWGSSGGYHFLCSINLDTGEYTNYGSIYDGDKQYEGAAYSSGANITGIYKDKMYIRYSFIKDNTALQSGNADIDSLYEDINFEFDFKSKTWKESELPFSWFMNNETYSYYDNNNKEMHIIYKDNDTSFSCNDSRTNLKEFNGKLFILGVTSEDEKKFYDLNDMSEHSMGEYKKYDIMGYYNNSYILRKGNNIVKLTDDELLALDKEN